MDAVSVSHEPESHSEPNYCGSVFIKIYNVLNLSVVIYAGRLFPGNVRERSTFVREFDVFV